ncbi:hypothetical protein EVAR_9028_1 [Eumeta japonica]|uniref:Uncharacterized protein n=1 Tax=Eumeta variegata TaxID=151549 RepID=A0A4C1TX02_EUMVA|nr:hypothetical protein EVAR_9028_1 [Eumeta japonica]
MYLDIEKVRISYLRSISKAANVKEHKALRGANGRGGARHSTPLTTITSLFRRKTMVFNTKSPRKFDPRCYITRLRRLGDFRLFATVLRVIVACGRECTGVIKCRTPRGWAAGGGVWIVAADEVVSGIPVKIPLTYAAIGPVPVHTPEFHFVYLCPVYMFLYRDTARLTPARGPEPNVR